MQIAKKVPISLLAWVFILVAFVMGRLFAQRPTLSMELWIVLMAVGGEALGFTARRCESDAQRIGLCSGITVLCLVGVASEIHARGIFPPPFFVKSISALAYMVGIGLILRLGSRTGFHGSEPYPRIVREIIFTAVLIAVPIGLTLFVGERDFNATLPALSAQTFVALVGITCLMYSLLRFRGLNRRLLKWSSVVAILTVGFGLLIRTPWYFAICASVAILGVASAATIAISATHGEAISTPLTS